MRSAHIALMLITVVVMSATAVAQEGTVTPSETPAAEAAPAAPQNTITETPLPLFPVPFIQAADLSASDSVKSKAFAPARKGTKFSTTTRAVTLRLLVRDFPKKAVIAVAWYFDKFSIGGEECAAQEFGKKNIKEFYLTKFNQTFPAGNYHVTIRWKGTDKKITIPFVVE